MTAEARPYNRLSHVDVVKAYELFRKVLVKSETQRDRWVYKGDHSDEQIGKQFSPPFPAYVIASLRTKLGYKLERGNIEAMYAPHEVNRADARARRAEHEIGHLLLDLAKRVSAIEAYLGKSPDDVNN